MLRTILLALVLTSVPAAFADDKIGVILPLTGDFSYFGEETRQGMTIAMDEIAAVGTKLPSMVFEDDKCAAKDAVTAYRRLVDVEKVRLVIGPACSTAIYSLAPIATKNPTPILFLLDSGPRVAELPDPMYSIGFDPSKLAASLAGDMWRRKLSQVALLTEDEEYAIVISNSFEKSLATLGGSIVARELIPLNSTDFKANIARALSGKPEALFFSSAYQSGVFLKQLRQASSDIPVYGNDTMCVADTITSAGAAAEGARCANVMLNESRPAVKDFRKALEVKFKRSPASLFYAAMGHDSIHLAFNELKLSKSSGKLLLGTDTRTLSGMYDVTPSVLEIKGGKLTLVSEKLQEQTHDIK